MKLLPLSVFLIIHSMVGVFAQALPNPTAWWKLEGNANDYAGGANGIANNIQWVTSSLQGTDRTVALFNGTAAISVAEQANLQLGSTFSLTAWVNASQWQPTRFAIFNAGGAVNTAEPSYSFSVGASDDGFQMSGMNDYPINSKTYFYGGSYTALSSNTWNHFAMTYDGSTVRTFLNGLVISNGGGVSNAVNISPYTNFGTLRIGENHAQEARMYGMMSDLRIYDTALTDVQVAEVATVPEPSTYALLLLSGAASIFAFKRRKR